VIEVNNLHVYFPHVKALIGVSLEIYLHEKVGFIGANGSGKSTLVKTLVGINKPTRGFSRIAGLDCFSNRERIWNLMELLNLDERLPEAYNTYENMQLFSPHLTMAQVKRRAEELLCPEVLDLLERDRIRPLAHLSTGSRQKATIAALRDLPYLVLDEPTMGFDPNTNYRFRQYVLGLKKTTIWITHNMLDAEKMNRVFVLRYGELLGWGPPALLKEWTNSNDLEDVYRILTATDISPMVCARARVLSSPDLNEGQCRVRGLHLDAGQRILCGPLVLENTTPSRGATDNEAQGVIELCTTDAERLDLGTEKNVERAVCFQRPVPVPGRSV